MKIPFKLTFWRVVGAIIAISAIYMAICVTFFVLGSSQKWEHDCAISEKLGYHNSSEGGYIYDLQTMEIIIPYVNRYIEPLANDSIAIFWWGDKRGYFNINSGEIISQPQYEAAWLFSSGVGAAAKGDSILFIGLDGKPIHNKKFKRIKGEEYIYKGDYCTIKVADKYGAIDKNGEWVIQPEWDYTEVWANGLLTAWKNGRSVTVYDRDSIMPFPNRLDIVGDTIYSYSDSTRIYIRQRKSDRHPQ